MTRHNLDSHISWLLSHEVTFPVTVNATNSAALSAADVEEEQISNEDIFQEALRAASISAHVNQLEINVAQEFIRPPLPSSKSQLPEATRISADRSMGKLASASRPTRPGLFSQHQLATPVSTSGTNSSAGSHSRTGLTGNYTALLREERNGTPSARSTIDRSLSRFPQAFQTPQTPRQTPRPTIEPKIETVESVDLTGDDVCADSTSRSSSSDVPFGPPVVLWREDSASRAEPPARTSRKRKSGEMSPERSTRIVKHGNERMKVPQSQQENLDGFVDIDDLPKRPESSRASSQIRLSKSVQPSVELEYYTGEVEEEYQITETISTVETRTRKSISRVPSITSGTPPRQRHVPPPSARKATEPVGTNEPSRTIVQVAASPAVRPSKSPSKKASPTPQNQQKWRLQRSIQDSEDDEYPWEVEKRASSSPRTSVKTSPRVIEASKSPTWGDLPAFSPVRNTGRPADFSESKPRVGSPLRQISRNIAVGKSNVYSPSQGDSPTKISLPRASKPKSDQKTPSSSLALDDKRLVDAYIKKPEAISLYYQRVINLLAQNAIASMSYVDDGKPAPGQLKEERKALLVMKDAYVELQSSAKQHKGLMDQKKILAQQILDLINTDNDTSHLECEQAKFTKDMRRLEKKIVQLLHDSGAVRDGFGTGLDHDAKAVASTESSTIFGTSVPLPVGSSATGSAQVILQTQLPSFQSRIAASHDDRAVEEFPLRPSTDRSAPGIGDVQRSDSPLPPQYPIRASSPDKPASYAQTKQSNSVIQKQPDFYRDSSPLDYGFDGEEFDDLLELERTLKNTAETRNEITEMIGDDFGDSQDDEELLEAAHDFEKRQSFTEAAMLSRRPTTIETAGVRSERSQRLQVVEKNMYSNVDLDHSNMFGHPWSNDVKRVLKERFKLHGFRKHQLDAINASLSGRDVFVLMPTGGGKSLCFQLPALVQTGKTRGITLVISPLLSLMQDQVEHLRKLNIRASRISSDVSAEEKKVTLSYLNEEYPEQYIQLLYVSPEMLNMNKGFLAALSRVHRNKKLARIVIDEAHCVSQWGHDFRPDYVALRPLRERFPGVPYIALTATATNNVKVDVMHNLGMVNCAVFAQSFNRPNLLYEVRKKIGKGNGKGRNSVDEIVELIKNKYKNQSGIIYTLSRDGSEKLADELTDDYGIKASAYHGSMEPELKIEVQKQWQSGRVQVVVATIAFGMGIDKADVRFVIHHTIPKSLECYYQETGRAGRDGKRAGCYLYYSYRDTTLLKNMIFKNKDDIPQERVETQWSMLKNMIQFCENKTDCRRQQVLAYFGEKFAKDACNGTCDNCWSDTTFRPVDLSRYARAALHIVSRLQHSNVSLLHCVDILRGASIKKIRDEGHDKFKEFGAGKDLDRGNAERLFYALAREGALREDEVVNKRHYANTYIKLGPDAREYITGHKKLYLDMPVPPSSSAKPPQKSRGEPYHLSTAVTSPLAPSSRKTQFVTQCFDETIEDDIDHGSFIASDIDDGEAFESMADYGQREHVPLEKLGPPIAQDDRIAALPDVHRAVIHQFVNEAKTTEEKLRNRTQLKKPFFTEANLREMAIKWTLTLEEMRQIPDINLERVDTHGKYFLSLIKRYHSDYNAMMDQEDERDMDANHQNVIDLVTDDEEDEGDDDDEIELEDGVEEAVLAAERSKFFPDESSSPNRKGKGNSRGGRGRAKGFRGRGKGGKKYVARRSNGSASGQSNSGVRKRASSSGPRKSRGSSSGGSSLMRSFGRRGGSSRGGGGCGGIGMMPT